MEEVMNPNHIRELDSALRADRIKRIRRKKLLNAALLTAGMLIFFAAWAFGMAVMNVTRFP